jgi:hypothetical protein
LSESERFRQRLKAIGLSDPAIQAAWPEWWSDSADPSPSARLELRFSVARKLGIDPRSLLDEEGLPRFIWKDEARFKHLSGETELELAAISSFGKALAALLVAATKAPEFALVGTTAADLRRAVLTQQQYVRLPDLLALSWSAGIPVAHPRVYPAGQKRMAAMSVGLEPVNAILLAKDSQYPPHVAFYLAHEIGHIALGHVTGNHTIIDMESDRLNEPHTDREEEDADRFALELLTGRADPLIIPESGEYNAPGLATAALKASGELQIEPGTIALCFGYSTQNWAVANSALRFIYSQPRPVWREINRLALTQLSIERIPSDSQAYVTAVLGEAAA